MTHMGFSGARWKRYRRLVPPDVDERKATGVQLVAGATLFCGLVHSGTSDNAQRAPDSVSDLDVPKQTVPEDW